MHPRSTTMDESRSAATLYPTGDLTGTSVLEVIAYVRQLPAYVRALCVDLRGVRTLDRQALRLLDEALQSWRLARFGMSRVRLAADTDAMSGAAERAHPVGQRIRGYRQAVVTRSLRERACSETR